MTLFSWTLSALLSLAPTARAPERLADAIATAAEERPIVAGDVDGRRTAALLLVTAFEESSFVADAVGDSGRSCGYFGIWVGRSARRCAAAQEDVYGITRVARDMLADALGACRELPLEERGALYLSGRCDRGRAIARRRWRHAACLARAPRGPET